MFEGLLSLVVFKVTETQVIVRLRFIVLHVTCRLQLFLTFVKLGYSSVIDSHIEENFKLENLICIHLLHCMIEVVQTLFVVVQTNVGQTSMEKYLSWVFVLLMAIIIMSKSFFKLTEHLIALTSVHIVITQIFLNCIFFFLLCSNSCTKVVQSPFVLLHCHITPSSETESVGKT